MMLAWRALIPISLGLLMVTAIVIYIMGGQRDADMTVGPLMALLLLAGNVIVGGLSLVISRLIPPAPDTNRRVIVSNSRFNKRKLAAPPAVAVPAVASAH
jgi:hypothetical protein